MNLDSLFSTFRRLLPILVILLALMANGAFAITRLLPSVQSYNELNTQIAASQEEIAAREAAAEDDDTMIVLNTQIERASEGLDEAAAPHLSNDDVDRVVAHAYEVAVQSHVVITSLRTGQVTTEADNSPHEAQLIQFQVDGTVPGLMNFVIRFNDTEYPGVSLENIAITQSAGRKVKGSPTVQAGTAILTGDLYLHTSPFSAGNVPSGLASTEGDVITFASMPFPENLYAAQASAEVAAETDTTTTDMNMMSNVVETQNNGQSAESLTQFAPPPTPTTSAVTEALMPSCDGAPPSQFKVGDTVVVDFNDKGSLNVLTTPRTPDSETDVLEQALDNHHMVLQDGPICGNWEGKAVLYWHVSYAGITGWVGEATTEDRWLCPEANPECT
jgi:hypothetical protein